jgi:hypothetical protein
VIWRIAVFGLFLGATLIVSPLPRCWADEPYSIESVELQPSQSLPKAVADNLAPEGLLLYTYTNGLRMRISEIFWVKVLALQSPPRQSSELAYSNLKPGALVGVIRFFSETSEDYREDFHDQKLRPGYYTMRYVVMSDRSDGDSDPVPGNFVVLCPARLDRDPGSVLDLEHLTRLGRIVSRTEQPAVLHLVPKPGQWKNLPAVTTDDTGTCVLGVKLHARTSEKNPLQEIILGIVVVMPTQEDGTSKFQLPRGFVHPSSGFLARVVRGSEVTKTSSEFSVPTGYLKTCTAPS